MAGACPVPGPDDPLVRSLLSTVDCNVQDLVHTGYATVFNASGVYSAILTALLTIYVAAIGYRLLLGRAQLSISDFALTAVKLGVVIALATQWDTYQTVVYQFLFFGPQQIADGLLHALTANGAGFHGDLLDGLQRAFTDLTTFSPATPPGAPAIAPAVSSALAASSPIASSLPATAGTAQLSGMLSKPGFDALLFQFSALILLTSSLGILLASKIVLGMLLAIGPIFIALLLFDATRGVFEGWLRASLAFAFAPVAVTLLLGLALGLLDPSLDQIELMRDSNTYVPGVAFNVMILVLVFAGVALGMIVALGAIAMSFRLPSPRRAEAAASTTTITHVEAAQPAVPARAVRAAAAAAAAQRRDATILARAAASEAGVDRRITLASTVSRGVSDPVSLETRLGQSPRRNAGPRAARSGARSGS